MSIEKAVNQAVENERKEREKNGDFAEKQRFLDKMKEKGFIKTQSYNVAPLDTIGKKRFNYRKTSRG